MAKKGKDKRSIRAQYIVLIDLILRNIKDIESIRKIFDYAQKTWFDEEAQSSNKN